MSTQPTPTPEAPETPNTAAPIVPPTPAPQPAPEAKPGDTTSADIAALSATVERLAALADKPPAPSQSQNAVFDSELNRAREKFNAPDATPEEKREALQKWGFVYDDDRANFEQPPAPSEDSHRFSIHEGKEFLASELGVVKAETKQMFSALRQQKRTNRGFFKAEDGRHRMPLDIVMRGAIVPTRPTRAKPYQNFTALTVGEDDEVVQNAWDLNDAVFVWMLATKSTGTMHLDPNECHLIGEYRRAMSALCKALDTTDTANWVPVGFSAALIREYELARNLTRFVRTFSMTQNPQDMPLMEARTTTYLIAEQTADPESATAITTSDMVDAKRNLSLKFLGARTSWSDTLALDTPLDIAREAREAQARSYAFSEEQAMIDGDTAGTHMDSDVTAATDVRKAFLGLRGEAIDHSLTRVLTTFNADVLASLFADMGIYGSRRRRAEVAIIASTFGVHHMSVLKDDQNNAVMLGIMGTGGAEGGGDVLRVLGYDVIESEAMRENLNASGVYDGTVTDNTGLIAFNRQGWVLGIPTGSSLMVETDRSVRTGQTELVTKGRRHWSQTYTVSSTITTVSYGIDLSSAAL